MELHPDPISQTTPYIVSYTPGNIVFQDGSAYSTPILVSNRGIQAWPVSSHVITQGPSQLTRHDMSSLLLPSPRPKIVLLGLGKHAPYLEEAILSDLITQQIGVESMHTQSACRTFNVLIGEGRHVLAALLP